MDGRGSWRDELLPALPQHRPHQQCTRYVPVWVSAVCALLISCAGYVRGNVWIVSRRANSIKSDATVEELERIARNLRARNALMQQVKMQYA